MSAVGYASPGASAHPLPSPSTPVSNSSQAHHVATGSPSSSSAGAIPQSASDPRKSPMKTPGPSMPRSPTRFVSSLRPPSPPQQEISEKVRDAFEDLELDNVPPAESIYCAAQQSGRIHARARSRSREHSRGRRLERGEREWDEKRGLAEVYGNSASASGPSNTRPTLSSQQAHPGTIQVPDRSSSLTSASFASPQASLPRVTFVPPPPYTSHPASSSAALPSYPSSYSSYSSSVRRMLLVERIRPWLPFLAYAATTLGFALAIAFWRNEVFGRLDELAQWLRAEESTGYAVMFFLIFLTCIRKYITTFELMNKTN